MLDDHVNALANASRVVLVTGDRYDARNKKRNHVLAQTDAPETILALAQAMRVESGPAFDIMEFPETSLVFLEGRTPIATIGLIGRHGRCATLWDGDRRLVDPTALTDWMP